MKTASPVLGFNNNVRHRGKEFHIQTEDSGLKRPHIITHLFVDGGRILKSTKVTYKDLLDQENVQELVRQKMKEQHRAMFVLLKEGTFDALVFTEETTERMDLPPAGESSFALDSSPVLVAEIALDSTSSLPAESPSVSDLGGANDAPSVGYKPIPLARQPGLELEIPVHAPRVSLELDLSGMKKVDREKKMEVLPARPPEKPGPPKKPGSPEMPGPPKKQSVEASSTELPAAELSEIPVEVSYQEQTPSPVESFDVDLGSMGAKGTEVRERPPAIPLSYENKPNVSLFGGTEDQSIDEAILEYISSKPDA